MKKENVQHMEQHATDAKSGINVCRNKNQPVKSLDEISEACSSEDLLHINACDDYATNDVSLLEDKWSMALEIKEHKFKFRIDTGAKSNILVKAAYNHMHPKPTLSNSLPTLKSYSNHKIKPIGCFTIAFANKGISTNATFKVVDLNQENIISGDIAEKLGLLQKVNKLSELPPEHELSRDYLELVKHYLKEPNV